jgi:hypothetical protein
MPFTAFSNREYITQDVSSDGSHRSEPFRWAGGLFDLPPASAFFTTFFQRAGHGLPLTRRTARACHHRASQRRSLKTVRWRAAVRELHRERGWLVLATIAFQLSTPQHSPAQTGRKRAAAISAANWTTSRHVSLSLGQEIVLPAESNWPGNRMERAVQRPAAHHEQRPHGPNGAIRTTELPRQQGQLAPHHAHHLKRAGHPSRLPALPR